MIPALALLALPSATAYGDVVQAKIPGQPVEISVEIPGFAAKDDAANPDRTSIFNAIGEDPPEARSTILFGGIGRDVWIWMSWRESWPAVASQAFVKRFGSVKGLSAFAAQDTACFEYHLVQKGLLLQTLFEAYPSTPEFGFEIRVVVENVTADDLMEGKKNVAKYSREAFTKLVRSLSLSGAPDRGAMRLTAEAYVFRDEAAKSGPDAADWTRKQGLARPDDWVPQLYLGSLARFDDKPDLAGPGFARASEILEATKDRDAKLDCALAMSAGGSAWVQMRKKGWAAAVPLHQRVLDLANSGSAEALRDLGAGAAFDLACCHAQTQQPGKAIESLKRALAARPEWKARAAAEDLLKPLRKSKEFEALVGK